MDTLISEFSTLRLFGLLALLCLYFLIKISLNKSIPQKYIRNFFIYILFFVILFPNVLNSLTIMLGFEELQRGRFVVFLSLLLGIVFLILMILDHNFQTLKLQIKKLQIENYIKSSKVSNKVKNTRLVVLPAFNEEQNLINLLPKLHKLQLSHKFDILIVNDCSNDNSENLINNYETINLISLNERNGQGFALRVGYEYSKINNYKIVVTMDSDNQHDPNDLIKFFDNIETSTNDLIIGSRVLGRNINGALGRKIGIWILSYLVSLKTNVKITDCSSGFKAIKVSALKKIELVEDQFQSLDILFRFISAKMNINEIPINISPRAYGSSVKGNFWKYGYGFITVLFKNIFK